MKNNKREFQVANKGTQPYSSAIFETILVVSKPTVYTWIY